MDEEKPKNQDEQNIEPIEPAEEPKTDGGEEQKVAAEPEHSAKSFEPKVIPPQGGHKKYYKHVLLAVILIIMAGLAWWFYFRDSGDSSSNETQTSTSEKAEVADAAEPTSPYTVAYAYKASDAEPYTLYWRPAAGGDRKEAQKLAKNEVITRTDVWGSNVAVSTDKAIYISKDGGKEYGATVNIGSTAQVTSVKLSTDGTRVVYGYLANVAGENTVKSVNLEGKDAKDLFTSKSAGVFINGYSEQDNKIMYQEGCYNCDGSPGLPIIRDLKTNKVSKVISGIAENELVSVDVNNEFSEVVYASATANTASEGLGNYATAPFNVYTVNLEDLKSTKVTTFGEKNEKNANGTLKTRVVTVGYSVGIGGSYYTNDKQLFVVEEGKPSNIFEASKNILSVVFVSDAQIFTTAGSDTADHVLSSYNTSTKKSTSIYEGDNNTALFGITTK